MKRKIEAVALWIEFILASGFLILLLLSDFGFLFLRTNVFVRVMAHLTAILLILSSGIQLSRRKKK